MTMTIQSALLYFVLGAFLTRALFFTPILFIPLFLVVVVMQIVPWFFLGRSRFKYGLAALLCWSVLFAVDVKFSMGTMIVKQPEMWTAEFFGLYWKNMVIYFVAPFFVFLVLITAWIFARRLISPRADASAASRPQCPSKEPRSY